MSDGIPIKPEAAAQAPTKKHGSPLLRILIGLVALAIAGFFGWRWWTEQQQYASTDDAQLVGDLIPITSQISGMVVKLLVDENQKVAAGQELIELDMSQLKIDLMQAKADLAVAQKDAGKNKADIGLAASQARAQATSAGGGYGSATANIVNAVAKVGEAKSAVQAAGAHQASATSALNLAQAEYDRWNELAQRGYVSMSEMDAVRNRLNTAKADASAAQEEVRQAEARVAEVQSAVAQARAQQTQSVGGVQSAQAAAQQIEVAKQQYESALAQVESARAKVAQAQLRLSQAVIRSPLPGVVGKRAVAPGQQVAAGQNLLAIVLPRIWVEANFKETQLRRLRPGQRATVSVDALPDVEFNGTVASFAPASGATFSLLPPENATGNFTKVVQRIPVRIELDSGEVEGYKGRLAPGMSVVAKVKVQ